MIVCFRFIGDVLVTTPLAVSIKQAIPDATVDYLVFEGTEGVLLNNPLIRNVITVPRKGSNANVLLSLFRSFDVALAAYPSDRTLIAARFAGKYAIGLIYDGKQAWWKKALLSAYSGCNDRRHIVPNILSLLAPLGIVPVPRMATGCNDQDLAFARATMTAEKYVILHPYSRNHCKYWPAEKWGKLAALIHEQTNCKAVFTTTPDPADRSYLQKVLAEAPPDVIIFSEPCSLSQLAAAIKDCVAFVGIDTVVTHMAAALEVPTIALFGPSLTRYWGPWPNGCTEQAPFSDGGGTQQKVKITVLQKDWDCVPCNREECAISTRNVMECLEAITPEEVFKELLSNVARHHQE